MRQEVSRIMAAKKFKILTLLLSLVFFSVVEARILTQKKMKDNLRWELKVSKDQVLLDSSSKIFSIKTLNYQLYRNIVEDLQKIKLNKTYFTKIVLDDGKNADNHSVIKIHLNGVGIKEFFIFKSRDEKYVIDFWSEKKVIKNSSEDKEKDKKELSSKDKDRKVKKEKNLKIKK